jgi:hypothetical protein
MRTSSTSRLTMFWYLPYVFLPVHHWSMCTCDVCNIAPYIVHDVIGFCEQVMYVTTLVPIVLLLIMWVRSLFLPGSASGMLFFITPDFSKLASVEVCVYKYHKVYVLII